MPIPKPRKGEKKDKFISRCISNPTMVKDFPDQKQRTAVCFDSFRTNEGNIMSNMVVLAAKAERARKEKFNGVDHVVIPIIALVEGVIQSSNSDNPELALASEFGKAPLGWNGRPVTINHPEVRGQKVSANSPEILETEQVGQLFNTVLDGKKLKTEAWINISRANELGGEIKENVDRLLAGDIVEVSTGLFSDIERESGTHDGEKFNGIWRNVVPDHLAILDAGTVGACSIADGCGANRFNSAGERVPCDNPNCSLRENAKSLVRNSKNPDDDGGDKKNVFELLKDLVSFKTNKELSHNSIRNAINAVLASEEGFSFLIDVFTKHVIIEKDGTLFRRNFKITTSGKVKLDQEATPVRFEADFVDLRMNEETVMDKDKFVADLIANEKSVFDDGDEAWLKGLDEKKLETLEKRMVPGDSDESKSVFSVSVNGETKTFDTAALQAEIKANGPLVFGEVKTNSGGGQSEKTPQTLEEYVADAPGPMQEVLNSGIRAFNSRKTELITSIKANEKNSFSDEALTAFDMATLESLAALAFTEDYTMKGGPRYNEEDPNYIPPSEPVFDLSRKSVSNGKAKE